MALTLWRWLAIAALGCGVLAIAYLPPEPEERWRLFVERNPETWRVTELEGAYNRIRAVLRAVESRDSLRRELVRRPASGPSLEVAVLGPLPNPARAAVRMAAERIWTAINPLPNRRLIVVLAAGPWWRGRTVYTLPSHLDGRTCVASMSVGSSVSWLEDNMGAASGSTFEPWLREAIAPCLYYGTFGQPGPHIEAWLLRQSFRPIANASWGNEIPQRWIQGERGRFEFFSSYGSFDAMACATGDVERCRAALFEPPEWPERTVLEGQVHRGNWSRTFIGDDLYFASLVRQMGRQRFTAFWQSAAPLDSAFHQAFGEPIESWTAAWVRRITPDMPPFRPTPRPTAVLVSMGVMVVAIGAVASLVRRRQAG